MRWFSATSGSFPKRLHFDDLNELDDECERLLIGAYYRRYGGDFEPPLNDDSLEVLIGDVADLDLFAPMARHEDGVTEFRPEGRPLIRINEDLMANPARRRRGRTTLAHEWFHAVYHRDAWEIRWSVERARGASPGTASACSSENVLGAPEANWMEFQAGYASCAILMPKSWVLRKLEDALSDPRTTEHELMMSVSKLFDVSEEAATWRLRQLKLDARLRGEKQCKLF
jgi:Zn-dependent peptidase ImmA (M78 family)